MNERILRKRSGMAVILALTTILLVVTAALELHMNARETMLQSAVKRDRITLMQMGASGVHLAMALLIKDRLESESDSLQEDWADEDVVAGLLEEIPFERGTLEVKIFDEMGKIQINALVQFPEGQQFNTVQRALWERFALGMLAALENLDGAGDTEETDPATIINAMKDWLDSGDDDAITGLSGAESDYYESLDPPYACKNGPFDHLSEVALVKGITPVLFSGLGGSAGLEQYVTVYGAEEAGEEKFTYPGKININTAELPVLSAMLPLESADFAPLLIEHREATSGSLYINDLTRPDWYRSVPGLSGTTIDTGLVTVATHVFRIVATAAIDKFKVKTTAVVERIKPSETEPWQCKVLNWKVE